MKISSIYICIDDCRDKHYFCDKNKADEYAKKYNCFGVLKYDILLFNDGELILTGADDEK